MANEDPEVINSYYDVTQISKETSGINFKKILIIFVLILVVVAISIGSVISYEIYKSNNNRISASEKSDQSKTPSSQSTASSNIQYGTGSGMAQGTSKSTGSASSSSGNAKSSSSGSGAAKSSGSGSGTSTNNPSISLSTSSGSIGSTVTVTVSGITVASTDCYTMTILFRPSDADYEGITAGSTIAVSAPILYDDNGRYTFNLTIPSTVVNPTTMASISTPKGVGEIDANFTKNTCASTTPQGLRASFTVN